MWDDVSPAVERAFEAARGRAVDGVVDAIHLFLALIEDDEGRAARVLMESGGDLTAVRSGLEGHPSIPFHTGSVLSGRENWRANVPNRP